MVRPGERRRLTNLGEGKPEGHPTIRGRSACNIWSKTSGEPDTLLGYRQTKIEIQDPRVVASVGTKYYLNVELSGRDSDSVAGLMFEGTRKELQQADVYELSADYRRFSVQLKSGTRAWVYIGVGRCE